MTKRSKHGDLVVELHIDDIVKALDGEIDAAMFAGGEVILEAAKAKVSVGDGDTRDSGYVATKERSTYEDKPGHNKQAEVKLGDAAIGFAAFNAAWLETGTPPHAIGKPGQVLRMPDGSLVRGPIQHPGAAAKPFLRPALDENKDAATRAIVARLRKGLGS